MESILWHMLYAIQKYVLKNNKKKEKIDCLQPVQPVET